MRCAAWARWRTPPARRDSKIYAKLDTAGRRDALTTLASRVGYAKALMAAVAAGTVKANELPADTVRQLVRSVKRRSTRSSTRFGA